MRPSSSSVESPRPPAKALSIRGEATRQKVLDAAEREFGEKGYHATGVADIALRAGVSQGTLYIYFRSKEEIFTTLVRAISAQVRQRAAAALRRGKNRMDGERKALGDFLQFVLEHPGIYRIIQECQFVDERVFREYYESFVAGYSRSLRRAAQAGELRVGNAWVRAYAMLGLAHFLGLHYGFWQRKLPAPGEMDEVMDEVALGMAPTGPSSRR